MTKRIIISPVFHAILYAAFIFALSSYTSPPVLGPFVLNDKLKHLSLYAVFAVLVARAVAVHERRPWAVALATVVIVGLYGGTDEFHQRFTPGRSCDIGDWSADLAAGMLVAVTLPFWIRGSAVR